MKKAAYLLAFVLSFVIPALPQGQMFRVMAVPQSGSTAWTCGTVTEPAGTHGICLTWTNPAVVAPAGTPNANCILKGTATGAEGTTCLATPAIPSGSTFPFSGAYPDLVGTPGQTYFYEVAAVAPACGAGGSPCNSAPSPETSAIFLGNPAASPTGAAASDH